MTWTPENRNSVATATAINRNTSIITALDRDIGGSRLQKEDWFDLLLETGDGILLDQATQGDGWVGITRNAP